MKGRERRTDKRSVAKSGDDDMSKFGGYEDKEFVAEFYDLSYGDRKDIDFFVNYSLQSRGRTLELGHRSCSPPNGYGRM